MLDWGEQPEQDEPQRPARCVAGGAAVCAATLLTRASPFRLGLGAKFLSHARAAALMDPLERRMQRQLGANRAARLAVDKDEPAAARGGGGGVLSAAAGGGRNEGLGRGRGDRFAAAAEPVHAHTPVRFGSRCALRTCVTRARLCAGGCRKRRRGRGTLVFVQAQTRPDAGAAAVGQAAQEASPRKAKDRLVVALRKDASASCHGCSAARGAQALIRPCRLVRECKRSSFPKRTHATRPVVVRTRRPLPRRAPKPPQQAACSCGIGTTAAAAEMRR